MVLEKGSDRDRDFCKRYEVEGVLHAVAATLTKLNLKKWKNLFNGSNKEIAELVIITDFFDIIRLSSHSDTGQGGIRKVRW